MRDYKTGWMCVRIAAVAVVAVIAGGCNGSDGSKADPSSNTATGDIEVGSTTSDTVGPSVTKKPTSSLAISGTSVSTVLVGTRYSFQPLVQNRLAANVTFTISNKPAWATFNATTGLLTGVPTAADAGQYTEIAITATNGVSTATLPTFALTVADSATGSVTVSWTPPTTNSDGSVISDLAGYEIDYGQSATALTQTVKVNSAGLTNYVIDNLTPGNWYFSIQAFNSSGVVSASTPVISTWIGQDITRPTPR